MWAMPLRLWLLWLLVSNQQRSLLRNGTASCHSYFYVQLLNVHHKTLAGAEKANLGHMFTKKRRNVNMWIESEAMLLREKSQRQVATFLVNTCTKTGSMATDCD